MQDLGGEGIIKASKHKKKTSKVCQKSRRGSIGGQGKKNMELLQACRINGSQGNLKRKLTTMKRQGNKGETRTEERSRKITI